MIVLYGKGENDYADDINARSNTLNYLSGGSVFNPKEKGLGVPLEMTLALHSDAGYSKTDEIIGSLGIYTTIYFIRHTCPLSRITCSFQIARKSADGSAS